MDISEDVKGPYASSPADIRATAENIAENYSFDPSILAGAICAALVSERERCAKVCEAVGSDLDPQYADHIAMTDSTMVEKAAEAIRAKVPYGYGMTDAETVEYARAAIDAISLLTPSMLRAGLTAMSRDDLEPTEAEFAAGYTAAIRDALGETVGKGDGE